MSQADPITIAVVQSALISVVREMRTLIPRAAFGAVIYEASDFSCGLLTAEGELVGISEDTPRHVFPTTYSVQAAQEKFGDQIEPGDAILMNDPYMLGSHMNDVALLYPFFFHGKLTLWIVVRAHLTDIGGMSAGSIAATATEVHQEGVRIPPIKVYMRGQPNEAALDLLFANVRLPEERKGDFMALLSACVSSGKRLDALYHKYGEPVMARSMEVILDRGDRRMRDAIARLPPGEYYFEDYLEGSGRPGDHLLIRVLLTVQDDTITVDFRGSAPQTKGPLNSGLPAGPTAAYIALKSALDPASPVNGGAFRPIRVLTEEGTILQARYPAATSGASNVAYKAIGVVMGALAQAIPEAVPGDTVIVSTHAYISGPAHRYIHYEFPIGGSGAVADHDGSNVVPGYERGDFRRIYPTEVVETAFPLHVECSELAPISGGAGKFRGGLGIRRRLKVLENSATLSCLVEPSVIPPYGVFGGASGHPMAVWVERSSRRIEPGAVPGKALGFPLQQEDVVEIRTRGGSGYGDPLERDPELVLRDLDDGFITAEDAYEVYGIVAEGGGLDDKATMDLRCELANGRVYSTVQRTPLDDFADGRRVLRLNEASAGRLGVVEGDLVELVTFTTAPLRTWVRLDSSRAGEQLPLGPLGCQALKVKGGDRVWVRPLHS